MQGLWKDTRKNFLKDKSKAVYKRIVGPITNYKGEEASDIKGIFKRDATAITYENKRVQIKEVCKILVEGKIYIAFRYIRKIIVDVNGLCKVSKYFYDNWYDVTTGEGVKTTYDYTWSDGIKSTYSYTIKIIEVISDTVDKVEVEKCVNVFDDNYFLYGKPFNVRDVNFDDNGTRRTFGQRTVDHSNRMLMRNYIVKADWDKDPKINHYTRSIDWLID